MTKNVFLNIVVVTFSCIGVVLNIGDRCLSFDGDADRIVYYFKDTGKIWQFGPYGPNHATAGTFAFKRKLLKETHYDDDAELAEEKQFLKNYTIPFIQLNPLKSILCFAHDQNTFDKRRLLKNPNPDYVRETKMTPKNFIKNKDVAKFYMEQ